MMNKLFRNFRIKDVIYEKNSLMVRKKLHWYKIFKVGYKISTPNIPIGIFVENLSYSPAKDFEHV